MKMKRDNYEKRKEAEKKFGKLWLLGKDYDHEDGKFESVKRNRGNDGNGTKKDGDKLAMEKAKSIYKSEVLRQVEGAY